MIYTDIVGNTLVAYGEHLDSEIPVEIAPKGLGPKIVEQVLLTEGNYKPKQW